MTPNESLEIKLNDIIKTKNGSANQFMEEEQMKLKGINCGH